MEPERLFLPRPDVVRALGTRSQTTGLWTLTYAETWFCQEGVDKAPVQWYERLSGLELVDVVCASLDRSMDAPG